MILPSVLRSRPVLYVGTDVLQLGEDLREEAGLGIYPEHGAAEAVDDVDAAVPEAVLVRFDQEWLKWVAYFVAHVTAKSLLLGNKSVLAVLSFLPNKMGIKWPLVYLNTKCYFVPRGGT